MSRVFVSHSGGDVDLAATVHDWLVADGHEVFLDRDSRDGIAVGDEWQRRLHERLRWADAIVCVLTTGYLDSIWCTAELAIAQSRGIRLLPVVAEAGVRHPLVRSVQAVDMARGPAAAREMLVEALRTVDMIGGRGWLDDRSPFPGLHSFDVEFHLAFFGRGREVEQLVELLRSPAAGADAAALLVVGPSGCGKSSLVRAGLVPAIGREAGWRAVRPITPGADPVAALARELTASAKEARLGWPLARVRDELAAGRLDALADELLLAAPGGRRRQLLVVVDQFEELLTQTPATRRERFAALLAGALGGPVRVVATLRPEFLGQVLGDPMLAELPTRIHPLRPLRREAVRLVIEQPARLAGLVVTDELVSRLVTDTGDGDALPLLAFTLAELADGLTRGDQLSEALYDRLGGVRGALTRQADLALEEARRARGRGKAEVIAGLLRLVTVDDLGRPTRWQVARDRLPETVLAESDAFVKRRLLAIDTVGDETVIGVTHEAFLTAWAPLAEAISAAGSTLRARRLIEDAAGTWEKAGQPPAVLWEGGQLASAITETGTRIRRVDRARPGGRWPRRSRAAVADRVDLSEAALRFLHASIRRDRRRRRRAVTVLSALLAVALVGMVVAAVQQRAAAREQRLATARQLVAQADAARDRDPRTALLLGIAAERISPSDQTRASLTQTIASNPYAGTLAGVAGSLRSAVAFSPDGRLLATAGDEVVLWDVAGPTGPRRLGMPLTGDLDPRESMRSVAFSPDGRTLAITDNNAILLWNITDPAHPVRRGPPIPMPSTALAFLPGGHTLAAASAGTGIVLWDLSDPDRPVRRATALTTPLGSGDTMALSRDGRILATGTDSSARTAVDLWDISNPDVPRHLATLDGYKPAMAFSPDGRTLATLNNATNLPNNANSVVLWDLTDPTRPTPLGPALTGNNSAMAFSPTGQVVATATYTGTVVLWDISNRSAPTPIGAPLSGHTNFVTTVAFSPDGHLASGGRDRTVILWDLSASPSRRGQPLTGHRANVDNVAFAEDSRTMTTSSADGDVIVWDLSGPAGPTLLGRPLADSASAGQSVAVAADGRTIAVGVNGATQLWTVAAPGTVAQPGRLLPDGGDPLVFSPNGHTLATVKRQPNSRLDNSGDVTLWNLDDSPPTPRRRPIWSQDASVAALSPDGRVLATTNIFNSSPTIVLWNAEDTSRHEDAVLTGDQTFHSALAFSPDGRVLATGRGDGSVILWDLGNLAQPSRIGQPIPGPGDPTGSSGNVLTSKIAVTALAFSPDSRTMAVASGPTGAVQLWDLTDISRPFQFGSVLKGHNDVVLALGISPDGRTLVTGSRDTTVQAWDLSELNALRENVVERACTRMGRGLDPREWAHYLPDMPYENTCPGQG